MKIGHTGVWEGKRVKVFVRNGQNFIDRFMGKKSGVIILEKVGRVSIEKIRSIAIYKGRDQLND